MTKKKDPKDLKKVGAKPLYDDPAKLQAKAQKYFDKCKVDKTPVTISGLILDIGFEDRSSFYDYEKKPEFAYTIKRLRTYIAQIYEEMLHKGNSTGGIFALKNFGWSDRQEVELKVKDDYSGMSTEELIKRAAAVTKLDESKD